MDKERFCVIPQRDQPQCDALLSPHVIQEEVENDGLDNFRDITWKLGDINIPLKSGKIYRSAHPRKLTPRGVCRLLEQYRIKSLLDLRSAKEVEQYKSLMDQHFEQGFGRRRYHVPLWSDIRALQALWAETPLRSKMRVIAHVVTGNKQSAIDLMMEPLKEEGLTKMNQFFLEYSKRELCRALQICADPSNHPVLIFCSLGKDRTGLVAALLLLALQVPREAVIRDYTSTKVTIETLQTARRALQNAGLDPEVFMACGEAIIQRVLDYLDQHYGSPEAYLDSIGFHAGWRNMLREAMVVPLPASTTNSRSAVAEATPPFSVVALPYPAIHVASVNPSSGSSSAVQPRRSAALGLRRASTSLPNSPLLPRNQPENLFHRHHSSLSSVHQHQSNT